MRLSELKTEKEIISAFQEMCPDSTLTISYDIYKLPVEIRVEMPSGKIIRLNGNSCGRIEVFFTAPPEKVKKYELSGNVLGLSFRELFEFEHHAKDRLQEVGAKINLNEDGKLEIREVEVEI